MGLLKLGDVLKKGGVAAGYAWLGNFLGYFLALFIPLKIAAPVSLGYMCASLMTGLYLVGAFRWLHTDFHTDKGAALADALWDIDLMIAESKVTALEGAKLRKVLLDKHTKDISAGGRGGTRGSAGARPRSRLNRAQGRQGILE